MVITQPPLLAVSSVITNVSCSGGSNGSVSATPTGGTAPYTYLWMPGGQTTSSISSKPAGTYTVTVKDSKGCQITASYTITQPLPLVISFTQTNVSCFNGNNGTANSSVSGGTPSYTYLWNTGATSPNATGLQAGTYTLTVTDSKGCTKINTVVITQPTAVLAGTTVINETCNYLNNGSASVSASGGTPGYTYNWQPGNLTTSSISPKPAGTYTVIVTDSKGCAVTAFATISEPAPLAISFINQVNVSCFGGNNGSVSAIPSGGTPNYTYSWMPGGATTATLSSVPAGTYTVTVTDSKGCQAQNSVVITQPPVLAVSVSSIPTSCNDGTNGSVSSSASGGTGPYTYSWMPGNYSGQNVSNLSAGTYFVIAIDTKGCTSTNSVTVNEPVQVVLASGAVNSDCGVPNGIAFVSISSGGVAPFTYLWSSGAGTNDTATGLISGAYTVVVTDSTGCTATATGNVNENTAALVNIFSTTNISCNTGSDGSITVSLVGGLGPFTYSWSPSGGNGATAGALAAGSYTVTVVGSNGCQSFADTTITEPLPISINVTTTNVSCFGGNNGTASAIASGGTSGYIYQWLPSGTMGSTISNLSTLAIFVSDFSTANCVILVTPSLMEIPKESNAALTLSKAEEVLTPEIYPVPHVPLGFKKFTLAFNSFRPSNKTAEKDE